MPSSARISLADLADATGITPEALAAEVSTLQRASRLVVPPRPGPARRETPAKPVRHERAAPAQSPAPFTAEVTEEGSAARDRLAAA